MRPEEYKIPAARHARLMERSRDGWKQRAAEKHRTIRSQRVTIRDLKASRDHWKRVALQCRRQLQLSHASASSPTATTSSHLAGEPSLGEA
jgi:hypothetical protein